MTLSTSFHCYRSLFLKCFYFVTDKHICTFFSWKTFCWGDIRKQICGGKNTRLCSLLWRSRTSHSHIFHPVSRSGPTERCGKSRWENFILGPRLYQPHALLLLASVSFSIPNVRLITQYSVLVLTQYLLTIQKSESLPSPHQGLLLWAQSCRIHSGRFLRRLCPATHPFPLLWLEQPFWRYKHAPYTGVLPSECSSDSLRGLQELCPPAPPYFSSLLYIISFLVLL